MLSTRPFIDALRPICEVTPTFDLLLMSFVSSLEIHRNLTVDQVLTGNTEMGFDKWVEALNAAVHASHEFRRADTKRQADLIDEANTIVEGAMKSLKCSVEMLPIARPKLIMTGWDDKEVEKV